MLVQNDGRPCWILDGIEKDSDKLLHYFCPATLLEMDKTSPKDCYKRLDLRMASQNTRHRVLVYLGLDTLGNPGIATR